MCVCVFARYRYVLYIVHVYCYYENGVNTIRENTAVARCVPYGRRRIKYIERYDEWKGGAWDYPRR